MALTSEQATKVHDVGAMCELMVRGYLTIAGYETFSADKLHSRADLIYVKEGKPVRVQVKAASYSTTGLYQYEQCRLNKKGYKDNPQIQVGYSELDIDEVWVVGTHLWCFPIELISNRPSLFLTSTNPKPQCIRRDYDPNEFIVVMGSPDKRYRNRLLDQEDYAPPALGKKGS